MPKLKMKHGIKMKRKDKERGSGRGEKPPKREKSAQERAEKKSRRSKKKKAAEEEITMTEQEMNALARDLLGDIEGELKIQRQAQRDIAEFHKRVGKTYASDMTSKEQKEASALYSRLGPSVNESGNSLLNMLNKLKGFRECESDRSFARGETNAIRLMEYRHDTLPHVDIKDNFEPYGAGALAWPENKRLEEKDEVVAYVESTNTWMVAEVAAQVSNHRYECTDIDDRDRKKTVFARKQLIPLPKYTVDYAHWPFMAMKSNAYVLALYPGTTCFYEARVIEPPKNERKNYLIQFVDRSNENKLGTFAEVSERYIVPYRKNPKIYIRPEKRAALAIEAGAEESVLPIEDIQKEVKKKGRKKKEVMAVEVLKIEEVEEDKDVPGPAPKARPLYYESPDEDEIRKRKKKIGKKGTKAVKPKKIKILRARVPEHKKKRSTRQFGKRRVKRKKPVPAVTNVSDQVPNVISPTVDVAEEDYRDESLNRSRDEEFGTPEADIPNAALESEDDNAEHMEDEVEDEEEQEDEEDETSSSEDSDDDDVQMKRDEKPHDPQEGCSSSYQAYQAIESSESEGESSESESTNSSSSSDSDSADESDHANPGEEQEDEIEF